MAACGTVTSLLAWHQGTLSGMGSGGVECRLTPCSLRPFGLSSARLLPRSPLPWTVVPAVPGGPCPHPHPSCTSVLHRLHLLTVLAEDAWALRSMGPLLEETVLHTQICGCGPGGTRAFTRPNPRAACELVSPELGRQTLPRVGCSPREPSCSSNFGKSHGAHRPWHSGARSPWEHRAWPGTCRKRLDVTEAQST